MKNVNPAVLFLQEILFDLDYSKKSLLEKRDLGRLINYYNHSFCLPSPKRKNALFKLMCTTK
jgi:hypothetical protein